MFFSAKHIDIKLKQDMASHTFSDNGKGALLICDGIGEYSKSGVVANLTIQRFLEAPFDSMINLVSKVKSEIDKNGIEGGTTLLSAKEQNENLLIEYLGNGGIIHLHGDYAINMNSDEPYRYCELMLPHVAPNGALTRHLSHQGGKNETSPSQLLTNLNYITGNIIILFSDGICSIEEKVIIRDNKSRVWRNENVALQLILKKLDYFLSNISEKHYFQENLVDFNEFILKELKSQNLLEDDASLGFVITESVLDFYISRND